MGYGQRTEGVIKIDPPINAKEIRDRKDLFIDDVWATRNAAGKELTKNAYILVQKEVTYTEDAELVRTRGIAIVVPGPDEQFSRYSIAEDIQEIIDAFPDRVYTGRILLTGEDGAQSAIRIRGGVAEEIYPEIVWPE